MLERGLARGSFARGQGLCPPGEQEEELIRLVAEEDGVDRQEDAGEDAEHGEREGEVAPGWGGDGGPDETEQGFDGDQAEGEKTDVALGEGNEEVLVVDGALTGGLRKCVPQPHGPPLMAMGR